MNAFVKQYLTRSYWHNLLMDFVQALHTVKFWKELFLMTFGMFVAAAGIYYFLLPSHIIVGSISGLSLVMNTLFGGTPDTFSYWMMGINAFLLILAFLLIGNEFGAKTVYTAMILGPLTQVWDKIYPYTNLTHEVIDNPNILAQLQAGETVLDANGNPYILNRAGELMVQVKDTVMSAGIGSGDVWFDLICFVCLLSACQAFEFRINASTGGLDILGKIINKYLHFDIGRSVAIAGAMICCTAFFINDFRMVVIGLIGTAINGIVVDQFMVSLRNRKRVCVISPNHEQIRHYIIDECHRGCTLYPTRGGYNGEEQTEVQALLTKDEFISLLKFIREQEIHAFVTASNCSEIYGLWADPKKGNAEQTATLEQIEL